MRQLVNPGSKANTDNADLVVNGGSRQLDGSNFDQSALSSN